jgi:hypothetical protein
MSKDRRDYGTAELLTRQNILFQSFALLRETWMD